MRDRHRLYNDRHNLCTKFNFAIFNLTVTIQYLNTTKTFVNLKRRTMSKTITNVALTGVRLFSKDLGIID